MFSFKRFHVDDSHCAMKVGTDGVLLGAWFDAGSDDGDKVGRILDIGSGCGLIALMAAQRTTNNIHIDAIDIDKDCIADAATNIDASPWAGRITLHHIAFDDFARETPAVAYDRIVSNPPYFTDSLLPPDSGRAGARHTVSLALGDLARGAARLLKPNGLLAVILPPEEAGTFIAECGAARLHPRRRTTVHAFAHTPPKRVLLELGFDQSTLTQTASHHAATPPPQPEPSPSAAKEDRLVIHGSAHGTFTAEYQALTRDFYLKF